MNLQRATRGLLVLLMLMAPAMALEAQTSPTPEGTVIKNKAVATWTDANNNTYAAVADSVLVTVGFQAGIDVTAVASVAPSSPSVGNVHAFTITNTGNGTDQILLAVAADAGLTITGYRFNGVTYGTLAELNVALASYDIVSGGSVVVEVIYNVDAGQGGNVLHLSLTGTSRRDGTTSDTFTATVTPGVSTGVSVAPDGDLVDRLPSNGNTYTAIFTVYNAGNQAATFDLLAAVTGSAVSLVSLNGIAGTTLTLNILAGGTATVTVIYTVGDVPAGTTDVIRLTATSQASAAVTDDGTITVRVVRPALTITKVAYRDDQVTAIGGADRVFPGEYIRYQVTVTNSGTADATTVEVSDPLPMAVTFDSSAGDLPGWTLGSSGGTVTATLTGNLPPGVSRYFWIRVRVN